MHSFDPPPYSRIAQLDAAGPWLVFTHPPKVPHVARSRAAEALQQVRSVVTEAAKERDGAPNRPQ